MNKILFISMHNPAISSGGGLATRSFIEAFSGISGGQIDICLVDSCNVNKSMFEYDTFMKVPERSIFSKIFSLFTGEMHRFTEYIKHYLQTRSEEYLYCVFDTSTIGGTLVEYVNGLGIKTITIHHNYQPEYFWDNKTSYIKDGLFLQHVKNNEKTAYFKSDYNLFLTLSDLEKFRIVYGENKKKNALLGCFELKNRPKYILNRDFDRMSSRLTLIISGTLSAIETKKGIDYFLDEIYPSITEKYDLVITGRDPSQHLSDKIQKLATVTLIPNPSNIFDIIDKADIYVCPTFNGGGLKLRIMDGLRLGLPVLAHTISARGYESFVNSSIFKTFDLPESFIHSLDVLSELIHEGQISRKEIQDMYYKEFSFESGVDRLLNAIGQIHPVKRF